MEDLLTNFFKYAFIVIGSCIGWFIGEFQPTFPLAAVAIIFIISDAWTAYQLDKRVHIRYPNKVSRKKAKFNSFEFSKVIKVTIPKRIWLIILAYIVDHWVFPSMSVPLPYVITGAICFEQAWSMAENESSCRSDNDSRFWKLLQKIMVDKTARHLDMDTQELEDALQERQTSKK